jgi:hypothetical protein
VDSTGQPATRHGRFRRSRQVLPNGSGPPRTTLEPGFRLAKVEVVGSNPVIRSWKPRFGGVSAFVSNSSGTSVGGHDRVSPSSHARPAATRSELLGLPSPQHCNGLGPDVDGAVAMLAPGASVTTARPLTVTRTRRTEDAPAREAHVRPAEAERLAAPSPVSDEQPAVRPRMRPCSRMSAYLASRCGDRLSDALPRRGRMCCSMYLVS